MGGTISLIKEGGDKWTLTRDNTYTGTTTVNGGTLRLAGSLASPSALVVNGTLQTAGNLPATTAVTVSGRRPSVQIIATFLPYQHPPRPA